MAEADRPPSNLPELVPAAVFMEDVNSFMQGKKAEDVLTELRGAHQKYKYIEAELVQRKRRLAFKQPEIRKCLDAVTLLLARREAGEATVLDFSLSDNVFARAKVEDVSSVNLWLGADVMLEYDLEDAKQLLETQLEGCGRQLEVVQWEHEYIKDQLTTTEVSMARVYNYDVQQRRAGGSSGGDGGASLHYYSSRCGGDAMLAALDDPAAYWCQDGGAMDRRSSPGAALVATPAGLVRNVGPADSQWNVLSPGLGTSLGCGSASTPGGPTLLGVAGGTPCGIPTLPLLSPGATPMLGIGPGGLAAAGTCSKSLEQVVSVATDPLSMHYVYLSNMTTVDVYEEMMDALMEGRLHGSGADAPSPPSMMRALSLTPRGPPGLTGLTPRGPPGLDGVQPLGSIQPCPSPYNPAAFPSPYGQPSPYQHPYQHAYAYQQGGHGAYQHQHHSYQHGGNGAYQHGGYTPLGKPYPNPHPAPGDCGGGGGGGYQPLGKPHPYPHHAAPAASSGTHLGGDRGGGYVPVGKPAGYPFGKPSAYPPGGAVMLADERSITPAAVLDEEEMEGKDVGAAAAPPPPPPHGRRVRTPAMRTPTQDRVRRGGLPAPSDDEPLLLPIPGPHPAFASEADSASHQPPLAPASSGSLTCVAEGEDGTSLDLSVPFLEDNGYFDMTLQEAAAKLGVGVTTLKKLCRQNGLGRWPYRARCSLRKLRDKMKEYFACAPSHERDAADSLMEREFGRLARMNVGAIDDAIKQFRQAMFKLEFKARQQLAAADADAGGAARKRPASVCSVAAAGAEPAELSGVIHDDEQIWQQAMVHLRRLLTNCADDY